MSQVKTKSPPSSNPIRLTEQLATLVSERVDREQGVIRGVKILGFDSGNGRTYTRDALQRAIPMYEGVKVNIDHPDPRTPAAPRDPDDRFGKLLHVRLTEDGLYGDLHFLKSHPLAERVCEAAEHHPDLFGLSHNAKGMVKETDKGHWVIHEIVRVQSVDLVSDPGTTRGLFEADAGDNQMPETNTNMLPADADPTPTGDQSTPTAELTPAQQVKQTFIQRCLEILEDDNAELNDKLKKIRDILKAADEAAKLMDDAEEASPEPVSESQQPVEDRRWTAFQLLESKGITPTTSLVNTLAKLPSQDDMASVLAHLRPASRSTTTAKPRSAETILEHQSADRPKLAVNTQDNAAVARFLRGC